MYRNDRHLEAKEERVDHYFMEFLGSHFFIEGLERHRFELDTYLAEVHKEFIGNEGS